MQNSSPDERFRALFICDVYLVSRAAQGDRLLNLLKVYDVDVIYLVGEFIDSWKMRRGA